MNKDSAQRTSHGTEGALSALCEGTNELSIDISRNSDYRNYLQDNPSNTDFFDNASNKEHFLGYLPNLQENTCINNSGMPVSNTHQKTSAGLNDDQANVTDNHNKAAASMHDHQALNDELTDLETDGAQCSPRKPNLHFDSSVAPTVSDSTLSSRTQTTPSESPMTNDHLELATNLDDNIVNTEAKFVNNDLDLAESLKSNASITETIADNNNIELTQYLYGNTEPKEVNNHVDSAANVKGNIGNTEAIAVNNHLELATSLNSKISDTEENMSHHLKTAQNSNGNTGYAEAKFVNNNFDFSANRYGNTNNTVSNAANNQPESTLISHGNTNNLKAETVNNHLELAKQIDSNTIRTPGKSINNSDFLPNANGNTNNSNSVKNDQEQAMSMEDYGYYSISETEPAASRNCTNDDNSEIHVVDNHEPNSSNSSCDNAEVTFEVTNRPASRINDNKNALPSCSKSSVVSEDSTSTSTSITATTNSETNMYVAGAPNGFPGNMQDFIIIHADDDIEIADEVREHIQVDLRELNVTVDLITETGIGKSKLEIVEDLHERYRAILILVTETFCKDRLARFMSDIIIMAGFDDKNDKKEWRVIPVLTKQKLRRPPCLKVLQEICYYDRQSERKMSLYIKRLKTLVKEKRQEFQDKD